MIRGESNSFLDSIRRDSSSSSKNYDMPSSTTRKFLDYFAPAHEESTVIDFETFPHHLMGSPPLPHLSLEGLINSRQLIIA